MVNLSKFYDLSIYNTEGKYIGKVTDVVLNIKKGRISLFKTKALADNNRSIGIRDVLINSMRLQDDDDEKSVATVEQTTDIPFETVAAVGDIILVDQNKLAQVQQIQSQQVQQNKPIKKPIPKRVRNVPPRE